MRTFAVTVERTSRDAYGEPATVARHDVCGCIDWPTTSRDTSRESSRSFTQITSGRVLSAPAGSDIVASDTIVYPDGSRWHVVGDPYDWANPHTRHRPGVQVTLERVR